MLNSKRLNIRAVEPNDVEFLFLEENNMDIWYLSNTLIPFSKNTLKEYAVSIHDIQAQKQFRFIIELKDNKYVIGMIDLFNYDAINSRAGIGVLITDLNERNKGLASEAITSIIEYSKNVLFLKQLHCSIHASNMESIKLFEKLKFTQMGTRKSWYRVSQDKWEDEVEFQLLLE